MPCPAGVLSMSCRHVLGLCQALSRRHVLRLSCRHLLSRSCSHVLGLPHARTLLLAADLFSSLL